jgi:hypothetical protein
MGVEHGKNDRANENNDKAGKRKIFNQTKGFGPFCTVRRLHGITMAASMAG